MPDEVLEKLISGYLSTPQPVYYFGWQGGEPTLMDVSFFQKVIDLQKKYGNWGAVVSNGLQTNATLIRDEMAELFSTYQFLVGVSIDGPPEIHNRYRKNIHGRGSHTDVLRGVECLKRHEVEYNALVLVSAANVDKAKAVYRYLCDLGIYHHQYIPCVEFDSKGDPKPYSISGKQWGEFLCGIFDVWRKKDIRNVSVRLFDAVLAHMIKWQYTVCHMAGDCCQCFLIEYNGDVYPCDFFVEPQKKLGNITIETWEELKKSSSYRSFGRQKADWNPRCTDCAYLRYCAGDCLKNRFTRRKDPQNISWLCDGWKTFYRQSLPVFEKIAISILNEQQATLPFQQRKVYQKLPTAGKKRNDTCYCGSGKKYKYCHGTGKKKRRA